MDIIANLNSGSILLFIFGAITFVASIIVYARNITKTSNILYILLAVLVVMWSYAIGLFWSMNSGPLELIILTSSHLLAAAITVTLFLFSLSLTTENISLSGLLKAIIGLSCAGLIIAFSIPGFIFSGVGDDDGMSKIILYNKGFPVYAIFITTYLVLSISVLAKRYRESAGIFKIELRNILWVTVSAVSLAFVINLILPFFGSFELVWVGPFFAMIAILFIGYNVIKYNLWNLKLVATELFTTLIIATLLVEILLTSSVIDFIIKMIVTALVIFSSIFLIKSVRNEVEAKEEVERLLKDLASANEELQLLDKRKSEFLSIASHHLRDPLTVIKGYASMLLEGSFGGQLSREIKDAMEKIFESSTRLIVIVEDFLNITQIEEGEMVYTYTEVDFKKMVLDIVDELSPVAERSKLKLKVFADKVSNGESKIYVDAGKLRQVITNLIDNSIKYTPHGGVEVHLDIKHEDTKRVIYLFVKDTGIGMDSMTKDKIFNKFSRAEGVSKLYTDGSGLGLYIAKEILKKHDGRIWADSEGLGKGSIFYIEIPIKVRR